MAMSPTAKERKAIMLLNGFAGRTVRQVEREKNCLRIEFEDGGYLFVRAQGPSETRLKLSCMPRRCVPRRCETCHGIEPAPSE